MSAIFNAVKATSLPASPAPHTLYYIKSGSDVRVKGYVTDATGTAFPLGIIDEQDVLGVMLDGFTVGTNAPINSSNTIFTSFRNIQAQLNTLSTAVAGGIKIPLPIDCSTNPNYPAAAAGDSYLVTVGGRIGGASGELVQAGDKIIAQQTNAGGNQATVGTAWYIINGNIDIATTEIAGVTRIATSVEVDAGTDNFAYVTPTTLRGGVRNTPLTGYAVGANTAITATDSVLGAFGKVQGQLNNKVGGPGTANFLPKFTGANTIGNSGLQEVNGNLGLGVTPSAWDTSRWRALEVGFAGNAFTSNAGNSSGITSNAVLTSTGWKYGVNGAANFLAVGNAGGSYAFFTAPSGTAGNPISFTQAMTLDASGNLGIGATSPQSILDVITPTNGYASFARQLGVGQFTGIHFGYRENNTSYRKSAIVFERTGAASQGNIHFLNNNAADITSASLADSRMVITSSGNVGIGTTAPYQKLVVDGHLAFTTGTAGTDFTGDIKRNGVGWQATSGTGGLAAFINAVNTPNWGADLAFYTRLNSAGLINERMRIDSSGNVGIGTTAPTAPLHVNVAGAGDVFKLTRDNGANGELNIDFAGANANFNSEDGGFTFETSIVSSAMSILASGNVGIGTTAPSEKLHVAGKILVGTRANATGNFATFSTAGVLQEQTVAQVRATVVTWTLADW